MAPSVLRTAVAAMAALRAAPAVAGLGAGDAAAEAHAAALQLEEAQVCEAAGGDAEACGEAAALSLRQLRAGGHLGQDGGEGPLADVGDDGVAAGDSAVAEEEPQVEASRLALLKRALKNGTSVSSLVETLTSKSGIVTGYHQTSIAICHNIVKTGFRPGRIGWCGGGIYFASSRQGTFGEAVGKDSHQGCIIQAQVDLGKVKRMGKTCDPRMTGKRLADMGYNSIAFDTGVGTGTQYVVYEPSRVKSMKIVWENPTWHGPPQMQNKHR